MSYIIENDWIYTKVNDTHSYLDRIPMHNINTKVLLPAFYGISEGKLVYYKLTKNTINNNKEIQKIFIRNIENYDYQLLKKGKPISILNHNYRIDYGCIRDNTTNKIIRYLTDDDEYNLHHGINIII